MLATESWRMEFDERYPIYRQIVNRFCYSLVRGEIGPGDRIPSIRELAPLLKVNTNTIQRAYQEMERDQLIYSQRGTGYFVMQDETMVTRVKQDMVQESTARFLEEMRSLGCSDQEIRREIDLYLKGASLRNGTADN